MRDFPRSGPALDPDFLEELRRIRQPPESPGADETSWLEPGLLPPPAAIGMFVFFFFETLAAFVVTVAAAFAVLSLLQALDRLSRAYREANIVHQGPINCSES